MSSELKCVSSLRDVDLIKKYLFLEDNQSLKKEDGRVLHFRCFPLIRYLYL